MVQNLEVVLGRNREFVKVLRRVYKQRDVFQFELVREKGSEFIHDCLEVGFRSDLLEIDDEGSCICSEVAVL